MGRIKADDPAPDLQIRPMGCIKADDLATGRSDSPNRWVPRGLRAPTIR
jgi:hypothetical protein